MDLSAVKLLRHRVPNINLKW